MKNILFTIFKKEREHELLLTSLKILLLRLLLKNI